MTFTLETGSVTLWMGMVHMCSFQVKFIKGSLRKDLKKAMANVYILMASHTKGFGVRIIRLDLEKSNSQIKLYLSVYLSHTLLRLKDSFLVPLVIMENLSGRIMVFLSTIIGKKMHCYKTRISRFK